MERTAYLIDSVYKFRGLGDGTAHIDGETMRLLSSYTSLYLQIAFQVREDIGAILQSGPLTAEKKKQIDEKVEYALHFLDRGIAQFADEWRCYWAASYVLEIVRDKKRATEYLNKGLENVSVYDEQGRARLEMNLQSIAVMPDAPLQVVPDAEIASDSTASL